MYGDWEKERTYEHAHNHAVAIFRERRVSVFLARQTCQDIGIVFSTSTQELLTECKLVQKRLLTEMEACREENMGPWTQDEIVEYIGLALEETLNGEQGIQEEDLDDFVY